MRSLRWPTNSTYAPSAVVGTVAGDWVHERIDQRAFRRGVGALLVHGIGANTFIIVRIMEPFWFLTGIIAVLPAGSRRS